jgi:S1-C subfamily serine protease
VGVNTRGGNGYGFASPSNLSKEIFESLRLKGEVVRGWMGASFMPVS